MLFDLAVQHTEPGDWILFADGDQTLAKDPRPICFNGRSDAYAVYLYDLWDEKDGRLYYREDEHWYGHTTPRIWLIQRPTPTDWRWSDRGIHCGHLPLNLTLSNIGVLPRDYSWLHHAYIAPDLRAAKLAQYGAVSDQLSRPENLHALSIGSPSPRILPLPFDPDYRLERVTKLEEAA
jgi:hypothetical protein